VSVYLRRTGDETVLNEIVPFLEARGLEPGEEAIYNLPAVSREQAPLLQHCLRAIDRSLKYGEHGLPLMGTGDWNDGMNRVGHEGRGESVWLAWFLIVVLREFAAIGQRRNEPRLVQRYRAEETRLTNLVELAWDGEWYRRAYFDDGTPLGSVLNEECKVDSLTQSWAVLSGAGRPQRAERAMDAVRAHLVRRDADLVLLLTPAFNRMPKDPGYIKGYPPGIRENGGQYTHAAAWTIIALARLGSGDEAVELFHMVNPVNGTRTPDGVQRYRVEPYAVAGDVYAHPMHTGRGGWTWYTGSAGWLYQAAVEAILGLRKDGVTFAIDPCIPIAWSGFSIFWKVGETGYSIVVENPARRSRGVASVVLDGAKVNPAAIPLVDDGRTHRVQVVMGEPAKSSSRPRRTATASG
jgi:cyclic beta-1,2-glucan synthetase